MDRFFKISERGSSIGTECLGGVTTFLTMCYIAAVNPVFLTAAGISFQAALTATCFGAALMTLAMGLIVNRPIALASGMGLNAVVAYSICIGAGADWRVGMACVFVEGIVIFLLVLCGLREAIMRAIPFALREAICIGIGIFIALIGLKGGGIVVSSEATVVAMGDFTSPVVIVAFISIALAAVLYMLHVKGGLIISILVATVVGIPLGVTQLPQSWSFGLDFSCFAAPFQAVDGQMALLQVFVKPTLLLFTFSLLMTDFFDTFGALFALGRRGDFIDENGQVKDLKGILLVDSAAAAVGGFLGASSITTYSESAAGESEGARTGLSNVVIAILFIICAFLSPIIGMVSSAATCGVLVVVGFLMMSEVTKIDWGEVSLALPAFATIIAIPLTYSITDGIGIGFLLYVIMMVFSGRAREVKPLMWGAAAAFLLVFIFA